jgi:hypothetical protein
MYGPAQYIFSPAHYIFLEITFHPGHSYTGSSDKKGEHILTLQSLDTWMGQAFISKEQS